MVVLKKKVKTESGYFFVERLKMRHECYHSIGRRYAALTFILPSAITGSREYSFGCETAFFPQ